MERIYPASSTEIMDRHIGIESILSQQLLSGLDIQVVLITADHDCPASPAYRAITSHRILRIGLDGEFHRFTVARPPKCLHWISAFASRIPKCSGPDCKHRKLCRASTPSLHRATAPCDCRSRSKASGAPRHSFRHRCVRLPKAHAPLHIAACQE